MVPYTASAAPGLQPMSSNQNPWAPMLQQNVAAPTSSSSTVDWTIDSIQSLLETTNTLRETVQTLSERVHALETRVDKFPPNPTR